MRSRVEFADFDEDPRYRLLSFRAGRIAVANTIAGGPPEADHRGEQRGELRRSMNWGAHVNYAADELPRLSILDWEWLATQLEAGDSAMAGDDEGAPLAASAVGVETAPADLMARIDDLLTESWTLREDTAHMHPSQAPADENWRL